MARTVRIEPRTRHSARALTLPFRVYCTAEWPVWCAQCKERIVMNPKPHIFWHKSHGTSDEDA